MADSVSSDRWLAAQEAEREYWRGVPSSAAAVARAVASASEFAHWGSCNLPEITPEATCVELGIGPLGIGCAHFLGDHQIGQVVGVDPLALLPMSLLQLPRPLLATISACRESNYRHVVAVGESTGLRTQAFDLAILNNMLDHVRDPAATLRETCRLLKPGGFLLIACDVFSVIGRWKFRLYTRHRFSDSILVRAHPFRFRAADLRRLLGESGFATVVTRGGDSTRLAAFAAGVDVMYLCAQRSA